MSQTKLSREMKRDVFFPDEIDASEFFRKNNRIRPFEPKYKHYFLGDGHDDCVNDAAFSPVCPFEIASCSSDRTVRMWDVRVTKTHRSVPTKDGNLHLCWSPDAKHIIYTDRNDNLSVLEVSSQNILSTVSFKDPIHEVTFHPSGKYLIVCCSAGKLEIFKFPELKRFRTVQAHPHLSDCLSVNVSPNGKLMAVGASDATCSIWSLQDMICVRSLGRLDYPIRSVSFSHCSNLVASGSEDNVIDISWAESNVKIVDIPVPNECYSVKWNPRIYLLGYATAAVSERDRDSITFHVFGY